MPASNLRVSAARTTEPSERIDEMLLEQTRRVLGQRRDRTAVVIDHVDPSAGGGAMNFANQVVAAAMRRAGLEDWIPEGDGKWSLPLQFLPDGAGWVELMRLDPGVRVGLHRHTGEVHALNLSGERRLNDGRVIRAGDYVYEPAGNVDWWEATGQEPLIVQVVVKGSVEYLGPHHSVLERIDTAGRIADYRRHCAAVGRQAHELT